MAVDLKGMRKKYSSGARECEYAECASPVPTCHDASADVLALCDEVKALRGRVAAAPEVLREWPAKMEDAQGEWAWFTSSRLVPVGVFYYGSQAAAFRTRTGEWYGRRDFKPGEFFVRVP